MTGVILGILDALVVMVGVVVRMLSCVLRTLERIKARSSGSHSMWILPSKVSALMAFETETFVGNLRLPFWLVILTPYFDDIPYTIHML